jgi:hypothetical protein
MPTKKTAAKVVTKKVVAEKAIKKAVAPKVAKKAATKKAVSKSATKKPLVYANDQQSFWVNNGKVINSLVALRDALDEMEKEVYSYHAGEAHNDFAKWVSDVLADAACAVDLGKAKTPKTAKSVVVKHLKFYAV